MKLKLRAPVSTAVAIGFGLIVLMTYIFPMDEIRSTILSWVVVATATALLLGVFNLFTVHINKIREGTRNALYSFVLILAMFVTFAATIIEKPGETSYSQWIFQYVQIPIESSLMAVMTVTLTYASVRLLARRTNFYSILFVFFLVLTLLGTGPIFGFEIPIISDLVRPWVAQVLASAGARGILLGVALGTVTTGLRILMGSDRPFGG